MKRSYTIPTTAAALCLGLWVQVRADSPAEPAADEAADAAADVLDDHRVALGGGAYTLVVDTSRAPELTEWVRARVIPMTEEWYPKLVAMLPSEGFVAPDEFRIEFDPDMNGVAATSGTRVRCAAGWMDANRDGEAVGAIFHELVHVVQQYGRRSGRDRSNRPPGWLVEGIADYLRWFIYEPETGGAEISGRRIERVRYNDSYRVSGNFLHWLCGEYGDDAVARINAAIREGRYSDGIWEALTGQGPEALEAAWKQDLAAAAEPANG